MLSKEEFVDYLEEFVYYLDNFDLYWNTNAGVNDITTSIFNMLKIFLSSHFTEEGVNFIFKWLLEDNKSTTLTYNSLFDNDEKYVIDNIDKLWNYVKNYLLYG